MTEGVLINDGVSKPVGSSTPSIYQLPFNELADSTCCTSVVQKGPIGSIVGVKISRKVRFTTDVAVQPPNPVAVRVYC